MNVNRPRRAALTALAPLLLGLAACAPRDAGPEPARGPAPPPALPSAPPSAPALPPEAPPLGRLPPGVRPLHYTLVLEVAPGRERFAGTVEIAVQFDQPRSVVWMHADGLTARAASVRPEGGAPVGARLDQVDPSGVAALRLDRPVGPGRAAIRIDYGGAFGGHAEGLYKVSRGGKSYAFTQFEATSARLAFPSFDEPAYRTPFDVSLFVPKGEAAIANTAEIERVSVTSDLDRVTFATTTPLPTYLVALAVGPLDVVAAPPVPPNAVRARPLPLRGVATAGRGPELAYALAGAAPLVAELERYFGVEYPFDKLDLIAVPDKRGAMENPGAITFGEWFLLVDGARAPVEQRRAFASIAAHEFAHLWFGDLITMPWWNDLWLKEASATWMAARASSAVFPELQEETGRLERVHEAMSTDGLVSARQVRQEIRDHHDIANAYDGITYQKGFGVISMFERWLGAPAYQKGLQQLLAARRFGLADADDYLSALSQASGRDVAGPFRSFLQQPGVPLVEASLSCEGKPALRLKQSRYFPLGSAGEPDRRWQIPVCARYPTDKAGKEVKESCTLLTEREGALPLDAAACPAWVLPNADGAGYYRWSLPVGELRSLAGAAASRLGVRERMSLAENIDAGFRRGAIAAADALAVIAPLARDEHRLVAGAPMDLLRTARRWLSDDPARAAVEAYGQRLYADAYRELGWGPRPANAKGAPAGGAPRRGAAAKESGETASRQLHRQDVIEFLALTAQDPAVRKEAGARGRAYARGGVLHPEALDPNLAGVALAVAVQEGDGAFFDGLLALLEKTGDEVARRDLLRALGSARAPELAARARALAVDPRLRVNETMIPIQEQLAQPETQEDAWRWVKGNLDALIARLSARGAGGLPSLAARFCDRAHADEASQLFGPRVHALEGGPRNLAGALESVNLCATLRHAQGASLRAFFEDAARAAPAPVSAKAGGPAKAKKER